MMHTYIKNMIYKDVQNENETKKNAVIIRMLALSMMFYFLGMLCLYMMIQNDRGVQLSMLCLLLYGFCGYITYKDRTVVSLWIINIASIVWISTYVVLFGWDIGLQHYLFVCAVLYLFTCYDNDMYKLWYILLLCLVRFGLYAYTKQNMPVYQITGREEIMLQVFNTLAIFFALSEIAIVFNAKALEMDMKLKHYNKKLEKLVTTDPLTGLLNRRGMIEYLENRIANYSVYNSTFSIAICDIDNFKLINDRFGHDCGDYILKELGNIFRLHMIRIGKAARWGGEEFLLVFSHANIDEAYMILQEIMTSISKQAYVYDKNKIEVTMTCGVEEFNLSIGMEETIKIADNKLYHGKKMGKNRIVF